MRPLIQFLIKHYNFFLFLLLEFLALFLIIRSNYYQQSIFISSANAITGKFYETYSGILDYLSLKTKNKILAEENARLHNLKSSSFIKSDIKTYIVHDTLYRQQYEYINARVIANTSNRINNYITLDKGYNQGIRKDMGVISSNGIVGVVKDVSMNFSTVTSVLHSKLRISSKIKKNNYVGTIIWGGEDYRYVNLIDIPTHVKISIGDTIITSGYSLIFPQGIPIGTIYFYDVNKGNNFYNIKVKLFTDFNEISHVYVVKSLMREELEALKNRSQND